MKKTLVLFAMALTAMSSGAFASETANAVKTHNSFDFMVSGMEEPYAEIYYSCDSVEEATKLMLEKLGATAITVSCTGGFGGSDLGLFPNVTVEFDSVRLASSTVTGTPVQASWHKVELRNFDNCYLAYQILQGIQSHFEIRGLETVRSCEFPNGDYRYELSTLMAQ